MINGINPYNRCGRQEVTLSLTKRLGRPLSEIKRIPAPRYAGTPCVIEDLFDDAEVVLRDEDDFGEAHEQMMGRLARKRSRSPYQSEFDQFTDFEEPYDYGEDDE